MTATELTERAAEYADSFSLIEHRGALAAALVAALADLTTVEAIRTAKIPTKSGGEYSYKYADIADVVKLTRPILATHGLVALTPIHDHGDGLACTVTILHTSGDRLDLGPFPFPHGSDAQATGSMVTYHRRYALIAALGMAAGDDDDGASARARSSVPREVVAPSPSPQDQAAWAIKELSDGQRAQVKAYVEAQGYPTRPAEWTAGQAATISTYVRGLPLEGAETSQEPDTGDGATAGPGGQEGPPGGPDGPDLGLCSEDGCERACYTLSNDGLPWCAEHAPF